MSAIERRSGPEFAIGQAEATAREASNLVRPEDDGVIAGFVDLAVRTTEWLPRAQSLSWFGMDTGSAFSGLVQMPMWRDVPPDIERGWLEWKVAYAALLERNPRLELADMLGWIGEVIDASSWPYGQEDRLREWVDRGERLPLPKPPLGPWDEAELDESFYQRLHELRAVTGGWIWYDDATNRRVFIADPDGRR